MAVSAGQNYYPRFLLSIVSCIISFILICNILFVTKLRKQFYQILCGYLALADIIQCVSLFIANKQSLSYQLCLLQEYILQGTCLMKAFITVIICSVTWSIIHQMTPLKPLEFMIHILFWSLIPILCLFFSIFSRSAHFICSEHSSNSSPHDAISYMITFLLPICLCICIDTIYYINMKYKLLTSFSSGTTALANRSIQRPLSLPANKIYQMKLLRMIRKLKYYPLIFSLGWILEIISTLIYLVTGHVNRLLDIFSAIGISSIGIGVALVYFYHQRVYPSIYLNIISFFNILCIRKKYKYGLLSTSSRQLQNHESPASEEHTSSPVGSYGHQNRSSILSNLGFDFLHPISGKMKIGYDNSGGHVEDATQIEHLDDDDDVDFVYPIDYQE